MVHLNYKIKEVFYDFGYARVSTDDQNLSLQIDALTHYGIDKLFQEKVTGAKKTDRN